MLLQVGPHGVMRAVTDDGLRVSVFHQLSEGRWVPVRLVVEGALDDEGRVREITGSDLRTFPLSRVVAAANGSHDEELLSLHGRIAKLEVDADAATWKPRGRLVAGLLAESDEVVVEDVSLELDVPEAQPYGDAFYRSVAGVYEVWATRSRRPAQEIADANGVPVNTVRNWLKAARQRGFLKPGRKGSAG